MKDTERHARCSTTVLRSSVSQPYVAVFTYSIEPRISSHLRVLHLANVTSAFSQVRLYILLAASFLSLLLIASSLRWVVYLASSFLFALATVSVRTSRVEVIAPACTLVPVYGRSNANKAAQQCDNNSAKTESSLDGPLAFRR